MRTEETDIQEALRSYTHGAYADVAFYTAVTYGGRSMWESKYHLEDSGALAEERLKRFSDDEARMAEAIYARVIGSRNEARTLIRTERDMSGRYPTEWGQEFGVGRSRRFGKVPEVGTVLAFGVKSASKDELFAEKIARDEISGMGDAYGTVAETGSEVLSYRIANATRYLDMEPYNDRKDQREVLIAGNYRVERVTIEEVMVGAGVMGYESVTPREFAEHEGLTFEYFTSKKGVEMARFGTRVYPVDELDKPSNLSIKRPSEGTAVKVKYVDLTEI